MEVRKMKPGDANTGIGIIVAAAGVAVLILSLLSSQTLELKIALSIAALGIIVSGLAQIIHGAESKQDKQESDERFRQTMEKLEKIEKDIENLEQRKDEGIVIADVLSSGLKYYAEHMTKQAKEEKDD